MKSLFVASYGALGNAVKRIMVEGDALPYPVEISIKPAVRKLTHAKRAKIHLVLRACAHHFGYGEASMKAIAKRGEIPGVDWPVGVEEGGLGTMTLPLDTMEIPDRDAEILLIQLEAFAAESGVDMSAHETMEEG